MRAIRFWSTLGLVIVLASCGGGAGERACVPGQSIACVGPNGCAGVQMCNPSGSAYGECVCGSGDGGVVDALARDGSDPDAALDAPATSDGAQDDGSALPDGTTVEGGSTDDGAVDGSMQTDAVQQDAGPDPCIGVADGTACTYGGKSGWCRAQACCTGCWDGTTCYPGNTIAACGNPSDNYGACHVCNATVPNECYENVCTDFLTPFHCATPKKPVLTVCSTGKCWGGGVLGAWGCYPCGDLDQDCCPNPPGPRCNGTLHCEPSGCHECGELGQRCCSPNGGLTYQCFNNTVCNSTHTSCIPCGQTGQPCCDGNVCNAPPYWCDTGTNTCT